MNDESRNTLTINFLFTIYPFSSELELFKFQLFSE